MQRNVRKIESNRKYHNTESKLFTILKLMCGKENVFSSVHPLWALSDKGVLLEYDICIPNKKLFIEYDGIQHFEYPNFFHKTRSEFNDQISRDRLKDKLAIENDWKLIRIKYNEPVTYKDIYYRLKTEINNA